MITIKQIDEIIEAILDRIILEGMHRDEMYPILSMGDRNDLVTIIRDIIEDG